MQFTHLDCGNEELEHQKPKISPHANKVFNKKGSQSPPLEKVIAHSRPLGLWNSEGLSGGESEDVHFSSWGLHGHCGLPGVISIVITDILPVEGVNI